MIKPSPLLISLALWPYYIILTVARFMPQSNPFCMLSSLCILSPFLSLGGMKVPTDPIDWKILIICFPLTLIQFYLGLFMTHLLLIWDYEVYMREIEERGKSLDRAPDNGIHHGVITWLYTRYLEHPFFKPDVYYIDYHLNQAAQAPGAERYLPNLPYRQATSRPKMMEGLPQRQLTQIPEESESARLKEIVFKRVFKGMDEVECGHSLLEGTGAFALRWTKQPCRTDLRSIKCEFAHQHSIDKSWHIILSPADAVEVITKGWGERGPPHVAQGMGPMGMVLVYGPRNYDEREVFMKILTASTSYCSEGPEEGQ